MTELACLAAALVGDGKGILAADESVATMSARLERAGVAPSAENRLAYRTMLLTTPGLERAISGVILCDETFYQQPAEGWSFPELLSEVGVMTGIKVDQGAKPLAGRLGETVTEGLDGLRGRLSEYAARGARFAKWRAVMAIGGGRPSMQALRANAHALARYAGLCHEAGVVPVVEPEVLMDGAHSIEVCHAVTTGTLLAVFSELSDFEVRLDGVVLKVNMVLPGRDSPERATPDEVASATMDALCRVVPESLAGVVFLSGGQAPEEATANLAAIRRLSAPWPLSFSFGRALVDPALAAWHGDRGRLGAGQDALAERIACNVAALTGS